MCVDGTQQTSSKAGHLYEWLGKCECINLTLISLEAESISEVMPIQYRPSYLQRIYWEALILETPLLYGLVLPPRKANSKSYSLLSDTRLILISDSDIGTN